MYGFGTGWSNGAQLWWTGGKPGDKLTLTVPVKESGRYELSAQLTKARDYGIVQLYFDGNKIGKPIDLYNADVVPSGKMQFGAFDLGAGDHAIIAEITGANPAAALSYMFGLDYILLKPEK
jgi:hypothetical protein